MRSNVLQILNTIIITLYMWSGGGRRAAVSKTVYGNVL